MLKDVQNRLIQVITAETKKRETLLFADHTRGLITTLELAQQLLKTHDAELQALKKLNKLCNSN